MPFGLGTSELIIIMVIVLLVFGAKRLPEIGQSVGKGIRDFKRSLRDVEHSIDASDQLPPPAPPPPASRPRDSEEPKKLSE
jgi:sec-independent protein translocase protein TatA